MKTRDNLLSLPEILPILLLSALFACSINPCHSKDSKNNNRLSISNDYAIYISNKVDVLVRDNFLDKEKASSTWLKIFKQEKVKAAKCSSLIELSKLINGCLNKLETSHCRFLTSNDETFHFLESLFTSFKKNSTKVYVGFNCGGDNLKDNQVRYVLDQSPASRAGIKYGDLIEKVNGQKYYGYSNFLDNSKNYRLEISRSSGAGKQQKTLTLNLTPDKKSVYSGYAEATEKSVKVLKLKDKKIGYIHLWSGGQGCHDALDEALSSKLRDTDALVLDLRDGYGGNSLEDLDRFYRAPKNYPDLVSIDRAGKRQIYRHFYRQPVVAIINGGARSGKELLAFSLKKSGRALLLGEKTKGAVVAGRFFKLDKNTALYLAIRDVEIGGVRLEGKGVLPDKEVVLNKTDLAKGNDNQLYEALQTLSEQLK